jgi:predicted nuclease with RNAse H fold
MRALGIDLASQDAKTAYCIIEWGAEMAFAATPQGGRPEHELVEAMTSADWIGIDAPFGWPSAMVEAVSTFTRDGVWPSAASSETLRYRVTDWFTHEIIATHAQVSVWPLSVSSDRIASCAWRCARLLTEHAKRSSRPLDRIGVPLSADVDDPPGSVQATRLVSDQGVVEVYPAGALALWGLPHKRYKSSNGLSSADAQAKRAHLMGEIEQRTGLWLVLSKAVREACIDSDHAFDAFVSSVVACAAATGHTFKPQSGQLRAAQREGWIHLPRPGSLESLSPAAV